MSDQSGKKSENVVNVRSIRANSTVYIRVEDVVAYLRGLAATEETDVRERLNQAADNLSKTR
ncbi:MAG: hypothetical protein MN733_27990 [Nitrososphaera sp.]|nr:hypothetical protein [Nitrososphaera sp.]